MTAFLLDSNVWLALMLDWHPLHDRAQTWWGGLDDADRVLLYRPVQLSTLQLLTTRAVFTPGGAEPLTNAEAWAAIDEIAADPRVEVLALEPFGTAELWRESSKAATVSPKLWMDAYLSAVARAANVTLVTGDRALAEEHRGDVVLIASGAPD